MYIVLAYWNNNSWIDMYIVLAYWNNNPRIDMYIVLAYWNNNPRIDMYIVLAYWNNNPWIDMYIVLAYWNNNPRTNMLLHSDTLSWFRASQSLHSLSKEILCVWKQCQFVMFHLLCVWRNTCLARMTCVGAMSICHLQRTVLMTLYVSCTDNINISSWTILIEHTFFKTIHIKSNYVVTHCTMVLK
jgi:hypothetical protein